jgi:hypothetical protein
MQLSGVGQKVRRWLSRTRKNPGHVADVTGPLPTIAVGRLQRSDDQNKLYARQATIGNPAAR